ncbi:MAG: glycoside hydrolase family 2 TIM barrel-domain containing protein [bacterium]
MKRYLFFMILTAICLSANAAPDFIWREAETANSYTLGNIAKPLQPSFGSQEFSEGKWVKDSLIENGILRYDINVKNDGDYNLWLRIGFERVRAITKWRMDNGEWKVITNLNQTTNVSRIWFWTDIGWFNAGKINLKTGAHTLEVSFGPKTGANFTAAFDCLCLVNGDWRPDGSLKPGEKYNSDKDKQAADKVYKINEGITGRLSTPLTGIWQIARFDDPDMNKGTWEPVKDIPADLQWRGINVPGYYQDQLPSDIFGHRVWYRCRIDIPEYQTSRGYLLDFRGTNWIASVVVNGQFVESHKSTRVPWQCDITKAIQPGKVNEICIGIKDIYYAFETNDYNSMRNLPAENIGQYSQHFIAPIYPSSKGDADGLKVGITNPVSLVVTGSPVHIDDVFIKTSVTDEKFVQNNKVITVEATIKNPGNAPANVIVSGAALLKNTIQQKKLPDVAIVVPAGGIQTAILTAPWPDAELWWPQQNPAKLYSMIVSAKSDNGSVDSREDTFGFREVKVDGKYIRINGLRRNFWNLLAGFSGDTPEAKLEHFYKGNNRFERFSTDINGDVGVNNRTDQLEFMDKYGIAGRLSTMVDGMFITYSLQNPVTWKNFNEHIEQVVKAYRNHPSIIVYSLENELLMINGSNVNGEAEMKKIEQSAKVNLIDVAKRFDPTRPSMLDGAGALKDNYADIYNVHYAEDGFHPDNAFPLMGIRSHGGWQWNGLNPYTAGEVGYFAGNDSDHAWIGGELANTGKIGAIKSYAKYLKYLFQRYRWNDVAITCPWTGMENSDECWNSLTDLAAFTREYNSSFFSGDKVTRTVKVFNDTFSKEPLTFTWSVKANGKVSATGTEGLTIEPGFNKELEISFNAPIVNARTAGELILEVTQPGSKSFKDVKEITIYPQVKSLKTKRNIYVLEEKPVFSLELAKLGIKSSSITDLLNLDDPAGIVLIPNDGLKPGNSMDDIVAYTKAGGRVVILEQTTPINGGKLGVTLNSGSEKIGSYFNFATPGTPLLNNLNDRELSNWAGYDTTSKATWTKPGGSVRGWISCSAALSDAVLIEISGGEGEIIATQMKVGEKLLTEPAAQTLLVNMLTTADNYTAPSASVASFTGDNANIDNFVKKLGLNCKQAATIDDALNVKTTPIAIITASKDNLTSLLAKTDKVAAYNNAGGFIMLWGLEPENLPLFNKLMGTQHVMREFRRERVRLLPDSLSAGISSSDIAQFTDQVIAPWSGQRNVSKDMFTYCVDGDDIAPFCFGTPNPNYPETNGGGPYTLVNGLFNADMWWYIDQMGYDPNKPVNELYTFNLPVAAKIKTVNVWNNSNYDTVKDCDLRIDGISTLKKELPNNNDPVSFDVNGIDAKKTVGLFALSVRSRQPNKLVGLDEVQIIRELPDWYAGKVFPLVNNGGIVRYPRGKGGIILNQLKTATNDLNENIGKKQRIVSVIMQNLGARFSTASDTGGEGKELGPKGLPIYIPPQGRENAGEK